MKKCPFCAEEIQDEAIKCRFCGEPVPAAEKGPPASPWSPQAAAPVKKPGAGLRVLGSLLFLGGVAGVGYHGFAFETTVEVPQREFMGAMIGGGRVHNIGLMEERRNGLFIDGGAVTIGLVLLVLGKAHKG